MPGLMPACRWAAPGCAPEALILNLLAWCRYAVVPAYLYSGWSLAHSLRGQPALLALGGAAAACITLVPAELVEFRCLLLPCPLACPSDGTMLSVAAAQLP